MSDSSGKKKSLAGWTMVDSKGEVMQSDDHMSESSDSSPEIENQPMKEAVTVSSTSAASIPLPPEENEHINTCLATSLTGQEDCDEAPDDTEEITAPDMNQPPEISLLCPESADECILSRQETFNEAAPGIDHSLVQTDEGLGACCEELMKTHGGATNKPQILENSDELMDSNVDVPCLQGEADQVAREWNSSDSDSDFVQIDENNMEELEAVFSRSRQGTPNRSPSIAEGFNFLGPPDDGIRDQLHGHISDDEIDYDNENFNEDTESSAEDVGDDRIESDQSEVGSVNALTDVGDLSTFADIGDLPLEAGNVARNYRHRPNNRLSTALNVMLVVVTILTMGISIGLIMATDLEIEEWHNAYQVQVKKVDSLEWTLQDMNRVLQESKDKANAYESVLKSLSKAEDPNNSFKFTTSFATIVNKFEGCIKSRGSLSDVDCHALILPDVMQSLSSVKDVGKTVSHDGTRYFTFENAQPLEDEGKIPVQETQACDTHHSQVMQEMEESLHLEKERALHWQNLYLLERRQREWERENEDLEDKRERAQWEKEDREEDRREREQWEREEAENDRKERLQWEKEEQEEDRRDRERWEKEREEMDGMECLKKLMNTDLSMLKQHMMKWNVSAFDDFVNMSMLMSNIVELKQSVIASVEQMWNDAEDTLNKMGEDLKNGKKPNLDTAMMADYLKQAMKLLRSQFDDVVNVNTDQFDKQENRDTENVGERIANKISAAGKKDFGRHLPNDKKSGMWNKTIGKIFKKTSKSLRKFVRTVQSSWSKVRNMWEKKSSGIVPPGRKLVVEVETTDSLPSWLPGRACHSVWLQEARNQEDIMIEIGSPCSWDVRDGLSNVILKELCKRPNHYSLACNVDSKTLWRLRRDLKRVLEADESIQFTGLSLVKGREMLHVFQNFLRKWGNSELLMKTDKDWAYCHLQFWSNFVANGKDGSHLENGEVCNRLVNLSMLLKEVEARKVQDKSEKSDEDMKYDEDEGRENDEWQTVDLKYETFYDDDDEDDDDDEIDFLEDFYEEEIDVDDDGQKESYATPPPLDKSQEKNHSEVDLKWNDHDPYEYSVWYLKRAQYRIQMRRNQEKAMWFFDMSDHRDEMRKEHNFEKKSGQWLFDQADDREAQRQKDQQSDWMFERAHYRREEFAKKWSHKSNDFEKGEENDAMKRRKKFKDLTDSEWLFQNKKGRRYEGKGQGAKKVRDGKHGFEGQGAKKVRDGKHGFGSKQENGKYKRQEHNQKEQGKNYKKGKEFRQVYGKKKRNKK